MAINPLLQQIRLAFDEEIKTPGSVISFSPMVSMTPAVEVKTKTQDTVNLIRNTFNEALQTDIKPQQGKRFPIQALQTPGVTLGQALQRTYVEPFQNITQTIQDSAQLRSGQIRPQTTMERLKLDIQNIPEDIASGFSSVLTGGRVQPTDMGRRLEADPSVLTGVARGVGNVLGYLPGFGVGKAVSGALLSRLPQMGKIATTGLGGATTFGTAEAIRTPTETETVTDRIQSIASSARLGASLGPTALLPKAGQVATGGAIFGAQTAQEGGSPQEIASSAILGAAFPLLNKSKKPEIKSADKEVGIKTVKDKIEVATETLPETPNLNVIEGKLSKDITEAASKESKAGFIELPTKEAKAKESSNKFSDPKIEARFEEAKGVKEPSIGERVKESVESFSNKWNREFEYLPRGKEHVALRNDLLILQKYKGPASERALRNLQGITIKLDKTSQDLFRRKVILDDLQREAEQGRDLPFGFTKESLAQEKSAIDAKVGSNPNVQDAMNRRAEVWESLKADYIAAQKAIGHDVSDRFKNDNYFRHQVLQYANEKGLYGTGKKLKTPSQREFLRKRKGSELDINTDYFQAEAEVMSQMLMDIQIAKTIRTVDKNYNIAGKLKEEFKSLPKEEQVKLENWKALIPEGQVIWQPREGNIFFRSESIPSQLAEKLHNGTLKELGITEKDLREVMAVGGKRKEYVIPEEVARTLDEFGNKRELGPLSKAQKGWKVWQLTSPTRWAKFNARNISGDIDGVIAGNPSSFRKVGKSAKDLWDYLVEKKPASPELNEWIERGGMESTLQFGELGDIKDLKVFKKFYENEGAFRKAPRKMWNAWWGFARKSTDAREALLRYASYLDYKDQLVKGSGKPRNYGASIREEIDGLSDVKDKAFWLSNDLLGAYDKVSVAGKYLRDTTYPFWSWKEVNFKRYVRLFRNAANDGKLSQAVGRKILGTVAKTPYIAMRVGSFAIKASAVWASLQAWNSLVFKEEEESLPESVRARPHIIFGRDDNGKVIYFDRLGSLGDFLSWFGLDAPANLVRDYLDGKKNLQQIATEMAKSPLNQVVNGVYPLEKLGLELATRRSLFPDVFKPRAIRDRVQYLFNAFGLGDAYRAIANLPSAGNKEKLENVFVYRIDPRETAYFATLDEKNRFLKSIGKQYDGFIYTPRSNAIYNYKMALRYKDKDAATKYLNEYVNYGGTREGFKRSLQSMDPLSGLNAQEKSAFVNQLNEDEKEDLQEAYNFYKDSLLTSTEFSKKEN